VRIDNNSDVDYLDQIKQLLSLVILYKILACGVKK